MTTGHIFIATSLDGFVARADHRIEWLESVDTGDDDLGYEEFVDNVDGLVMGRGTYEKVRTFGEWPYRKTVVVMSRSLAQEDVPQELDGRVEVSQLDPLEQMRKLHRDGWKRAYVDGGNLVQSFLRAGLIADLTLTTIPVLIGDGIRLFGELEEDIKLELTGSQSFGSGLVQSRYRVMAAAERGQTL